MDVDPFTEEVYPMKREPRWWNVYGHWQVHGYSKDQKSVEGANKVHDYTVDTLRWGHNLEGFESTEPGVMEGWVFGNVRDGEDLRWSTEYGFAEGTITQIETPRDPGDLHRVTAVIVRRFNQEGKLVPISEGEITHD